MSNPMPGAIDKSYVGWEEDYEERRAAGFWERVDVRGENECWPWKRRLSQKGYGVFCMYNKQETSQRFAYRFAVGPFRNELDVLHACDNPACCNPKHLFLGTQVDNALDMWAKGRGRSSVGDANGTRTTPESLPTGERNGNSILTWKGVREIRRRRATGETVKSLGEAFNTNPTNVSFICRGKTWLEGNEPT